MQILIWYAGWEQVRLFNVRHSSIYIPLFSISITPYPFALNLPNFVNTEHHSTILCDAHIYFEFRMESIVAHSVKQWNIHGLSSQSSRENTGIKSIYVGLIFALEWTICHIYLLVVCVCVYEISHNWIWQYVYENNFISLSLVAKWDYHSVVEWLCLLLCR